MTKMTAEQALEGIRARMQGEWDNPCLQALGPLGEKEDDIQRLLEMPEMAPEAEKDLDPDTLFVVNFNNDFRETAMTFPNRRDAVAQVATELGYDGDADLNSAEFWDEIAENYNEGSWKGLNVSELNTRTLEMQPIERPEPAAPAP
ncbi:hypothetical protein [Salipiger mucosus]|uniref:Uncharacterized protein n=1 Tax=Salipiger mucosus DSM 16094 TaxID=1123237 RepID=S9S0Y9_9RHOB|nr:hypothetical protein [Salipiger mucosus]EPX83900.1 hypothetical protein Salmuc_01675 [Salipiger mucosus DSM 16094]